MPGASIDYEAKRFYVSQSWLQTFQRCPQRAFYELTDPQPGYNDATATGQAMHYYMEHRLTGRSRAEAHAYGANWLREAMRREDFTFRKVKTTDTVMRHYHSLVFGMENEVYPRVPPGGLCEQEMGAPLCECDGWMIVLNGTPDYVDEFNTVWDWKSASSEYNAFETVEWAIQPAAYTFLATECAGMGEVNDFTYAIAIKPNGVIQTIDVVRRREDWEWLGRVAAGALALLTALPAGGWPVVHNHHLCSPTWCPWWDRCRGAFIHRELTTTGAQRERL